MTQQFLASLRRELLGNDSSWVGHERETNLTFIFAGYCEVSSHC
jgi:hypothetical protein